MPSIFRGRSLNVSAKVFSSFKQGIWIISFTVVVVGLQVGGCNDYALVNDDFFVSGGEFG